MLALQMRMILIRIWIGILSILLSYSSCVSSEPAEGARNSRRNQMRTPITLGSVPTHEYTEKAEMELIPVIFF